ncbi:hypothetical protein [Robertkochia aurantiaca]|uniref:hypothetical protein n=1 Tax=Robertkochia aurantiaca TaxID=2873700 RepID=UPI001CCE46D8|nr:hypothetical protein [Robertkochia sp. 3YJGBD-33]
MMKRLLQPAFLFFLVLFLLLVHGWLFKEELIFLNLLDTYYVMDQFFLNLLLAFVLFLSLLFYITVQKKGKSCKKISGNLLIYLSMIAVVLLLAMGHLQRDLELSTRSAYAGYINPAICISLAVFTLSQLFFAGISIINLFPARQKPEP